MGPLVQMLSPYYAFIDDSPVGGRNSKSKFMVCLKIDPHPEADVFRYLDE